MKSKKELTLDEDANKSWHEAVEGIGTKLFVLSVGLSALPSGFLTLALHLMTFILFVYQMVEMQHLMPEAQRAWARTVLKGNLWTEYKRMKFAGRSFWQMYLSSFKRCPWFWCGLCAFILSFVKNQMGM